ncbi:MAG: DUF1365 domain-containing protein [Pseudomonadota bacterium]
MRDHPAIWLYQGHVMHMRLQPRTHRFRYRLFSVLLDIDRMQEAMHASRILKWERFGLLSFRNRDHGARDGSALRPWVEAQLAARGLSAPDHIRLLCFPRMLGYVFNPLSVYFCYDADGELSATVYEVKNTFGGQEVYALAAETDPDGAIRQEQDKGFWVSPFIDMAQRYRFTVRAPDRRLSLRIRQAGPEGETLIATHTAQGQPGSDAALATAMARHPLMTLKVIAGIHWEALRLFLKGVPFLGTEEPKPATGN